MWRSCRVVVVLLAFPALSSGVGADGDLAQSATRAPQYTVCSAVVCDYPTIAAAVAALPSGGGIQVLDEVHTEEGIVVDNDVTIFGQGMDYTIVQAAAFRGGASQRVFEVAAGATVTIRDMTIRHGNAASGNGGAILNHGDLTIRHCFIAANDAASGGGGIASPLTGVLQVEESSIGNCAGQYGGGVYVGNSAAATFVKCIVADNVATQAGGGLFAGGVALNLSNSTITGNRADGGGGGMVVWPSSGSGMVNCTVAGNTANHDGVDAGNDTGGGVLVIAGELMLYNTMIVGNLAVGSPGGSDCAGSTITSGGHNLFGAEPNICPNGAGDQDLALGTVVFAEVLGVLADRGGATPVHPLRASSPALDAADGAICLGQVLGGDDQRGEARGWDADGTPDSPEVGDCDIGAFETVATDPFFFDEFEGGTADAWSFAVGNP